MKVRFLLPLLALVSWLPAVAQIVPGTEVRFKSKASFSAIAGYYRFGVLTSTGKLVCTMPSGASCLPAGTGTVTSVGLSAPTEFTVTNSPVTGSGTLTMNWATQPQGLVFASAISGTHVPGFRLLDVSDLPAHTHVAADITSGVFDPARIITGGATNLNCLHVNGSGQITVTGSDCGAGGGSGITSLGGQTGATQTFSKSDDTNVTLGITSLTNNHAFTLGWTGTLAKSRTLGTTVYTDQLNNYTAGMKQSFAASATTAGANFAGVSSDPSVLVNGDVWMNTTTNILKGRFGGATKSFAFTDSAMSGNTTGNAATATAFDHTPTLCSAGNYPLGILASGAATGCTAASGAPTGAHYVTSTADGTLTNEVVATGGDNIQRRPAETDSNGGPFTIDWNPTDPTTFVQTEEFGVAGAASAAIGDLGWSLGTIGAAPTVSKVTGTWPNLGITRITTTATSAQGGTLADGGTMLFDNLRDNTTWTSTFVFALGQTTTTRFRIGFANSITTTAPSNGFWLRYDTSAGFADAAFTVETCASTCTVGGTTYTVNTAFHTLRISNNGSGGISFQLDANAVQTITTNVTGGSVTPIMILVTDAASTKTADFDFFAIKLRGLAR
jgi:hypothetical protein